MSMRVSFSLTDLSSSFTMASIASVALNGAAAAVASPFSAVSGALAGSGSFTMMLVLDYATQPATRGTTLLRVSKDLIRA
jgi:hypothetical protein